VDTPLPSVHNGWIKIGKVIKTVDHHKIYEFISQVEKPNEELAKRFFDSKEYLIHVGYMATKPQLLLDLYQQYAPGAYAVLSKIIPAIAQKLSKP
jgi:mannose-1-phosphate guanylyltransferase